MITQVLLDASGVHIADVEVAHRLGARMKGLLGRAGLGEGRALFINPCPSIHTFGMKFALDLIFVDQDFYIVKIVWNVVPNRMVSGGRRAHAVFELGAGWLTRARLHAGETVTLQTQD